MLFGTQVEVDLLVGKRIVVVIQELGATGLAAKAGVLYVGDVILAVNGEPVSSALQAVGLIRDAPVGPLTFRIRRCPHRLLRAAATLQRAWLRALLERGMARVAVAKPGREARLGVAFSPAFRRAAVVERVSADGLACGAVEVGDRIVAINGERVDAPATAAHRLRESAGCKTGPPGAPVLSSRRSWGAQEEADGHRSSRLWTAAWR